MCESSCCSLDLVSQRRNAKSEPKNGSKSCYLVDLVFLFIGIEEIREKESGSYGARCSDNNNAVITTPTMHGAAGYASQLTPAVSCAGCIRVELRSDLLSYHKQAAAELVCKATFLPRSSHSSLAVFDSSRTLSCCIHTSSNDPCRRGVAAQSLSELDPTALV